MLVDEVVNDIALDEFAEEIVRFVDDSEATLELELLVSMGAGEETNELDGDEMILELELPRELKDVEVTDVLVMGYRVLLALILLLDLETRRVLSELAALLAIVLSAELVESLELEDAGALELLGFALLTRLDWMLELGKDPRFVDNLELDGSTVLVKGLELEGTDGRKMTVAKISPGETLRLCVLNSVKRMHDEKLPTKEAALQIDCSAHSLRHALRPVEIEGGLMA